MKRWIWIAVMAVVAAGSTMAGDVDIGARGGYMRFSDAGNGALVNGLFCRFNLDDILFVDTSLYYHDDDLSETTQIELIPIQLSFMLFLLGHDTPVSPSLLAGGGLYWTRTTETGVSSDSEYDFGWHLGVAVDFALSDRMFVEAEFRRIWLHIDTEGQTFSDVADDADHWIGSVGIGFRLGE